MSYDKISSIVKIEKNKVINIYKVYKKKQKLDAKSRCE